MNVSERKIIGDTIKAAYRGSLLLYDNLGIPVDREEAYIIYCNWYNTVPRFGGPLPEDQWITIETMTQEQRTLALLQYAHDYIFVKGWGEWEY